MYKQLRIRWKLVLVFSIILLLPAILAFVLSMFSNYHTPNEFSGWPEVSRLAIRFILFASLSIIVFYFFSSYLLSPIYRLNKATKEVAKGNFNVEMEVTTSDEIGELTKNFNTMINELRSIEMLREDFISSISHELKTPIASIKGYSELLNHSENLTDKEKQYLDIIQNESKRISNLIEMILMMNRVENTEIIEDIKLLRLDEIVRYTILKMEPLWAQKKIAFKIELEDTLLMSNEMYLDLIISNLLSNAIKFSADKGQVDVFLNSEKGHSVLKIKDYGQGIKSDDQSKIFGKFYKAGDQICIEGNGLGLAIVNKCVSLLGGEINVNSLYGEFSEFIISLPGDKKLDDL